MSSTVSLTKSAISLATYGETCLTGFGHYAKNPLHTFPRNFPVDGEAAKLLATSRCNGIWETTRRNGLLPFASLLSCYRLVTGLLQRNWCNGFWPLV